MQSPVSARAALLLPLIFVAVVRSLSGDEFSALPFQFVVAQDDGGSESTIDPPFLGQRTTCDQCTIYNFNFWCPVDYSCFVPEPEDIAVVDDDTQDRVRNQCNSYCADVYRENFPSSTDEEAARKGQCVDMQQCFYSADQCSDCTLSSGHWCIANRKCYAFESRSSLPEQMNISTAPSEYICLEDCPDKSCIQREPQCPSCEQLRPPLTCGALLPAFVIASTGAGFFVTLIAWFMFSYYRRRKLAQRQAELLEKKREQRLAAKRAGRAATRNALSNSMALNNEKGNDNDDDGGGLRFEPTQVNYE